MVIAFGQFHLRPLALSLSLSLPKQLRCVPQPDLTRRSFATKPIPICFITDLESSIGGIAWEHQGGRKRMAQQMAPCTTQVEGDEMYSDGVKTYVISKEKMARIESVKPEGEDELLEYFKQHADTVIDNQADVSVQKVDTAALTKN